MLFGGNAGVTAQQNAGVGPGSVPGSSGAGYEPPQKIKDALAKRKTEEDAAYAAAGRRVATPEATAGEVKTNGQGALTEGGNTPTPAPEEQGGPNAEERAAADAEYDAEQAAASDAAMAETAGAVTAVANSIKANTKPKQQLKAPAAHRGNVTTPDLSFKGGGALSGAGAMRL